ncbi:inorganic phosphate transporter [Cobetia sp. L2A1]|uniref:inorganic phosphate transporter n=1 Tax=Cobetia sp. L2A1 TaxID=2686360 RepID=UPI00131AE09A|nr:inorganic phosphate transporter [Cobetia sp. L2A1]
MSIIAQYGDVLVILACVFGFFMAWGVGANDVANAMGTSVGSKAITIKQAILIAVVFEFLGAWLAGGEVTETIRKGIIDPSLLVENPQYLVYGMLASLLSAGIWLMIASMKGWPVSTTHSIVGAIVGFAAAGLGVDAVQWDKVGQIAASWLVSPLLAGSIAFVLFKSVQTLIFDNEDPFAAAKRYVPMYMFLVGFIIAMVTLVKGLKHVGLNLNFESSLLLSIMIGAIVMGIGVLMERKVARSRLKEKNRATGDDFDFSGVEKIFGLLMMFTACAMAFAHGSNDVANAVGPLAAIISVVDSAGQIDAKASMPWWVLVLGGGGIVFGLVTYGRRVIATVGSGITELTPSRGFAATLAAASTVVLASGTGLPISTTHTLVGAVLGVGLARGMAALNLRVIGTIVMSWLITLPAGAILSILFFFMFKGMFG